MTTTMAPSAEMNDAATGEAPVAASGASRDNPPAGARAWVSLGILLLLVMLSFIDRGIIALMVDPIKADLGISDVEISLIQGVAFAFFYAVATVPMGWLADRWSRRGVIYVGVTGWSLATVACGFAGTFAQLFAARGAVGMGEATLSPAANAMVADLFPRRRLTLALGILGAGASLGGGIAIAVGGFVVQWATETGGIAGLAPWQTAFIVVGAPGVLLAPLVFLIPPVARTVTSLSSGTQVLREKAPGYAMWLRRHWRYLFGTAGAVGFTAVLSYAQASWTAAFLSRQFGLDIATIGLTLGLINGVMGVIGFIGGGWLVDRLHHSGIRDAHFRYLICNMSLLGVLGVISFGFVESVPWLFVLIGVIHLLQPMSAPALAHLQMSTPRPFRSRTMAIFLLVMNLLGMSLGPSGAALASEYIFDGPQDIGDGIALVSGVAAAIGVLLLASAIGPARRARAEAEG